MNKRAQASLILLICGLLIEFSPAHSQQSQQSTESATRPRTVTTRPTQQVPATQPARDSATVPQTSQAPWASDAQAQGDAALTQQVRHLSMNKVQARISEAKRLLKSRPSLTSMGSPSLTVVTLAALDEKTSQLHLLTIPKEIFLKKGSELSLVTSLGMSVQLRIIRANGVNTAVTVFDNAGGRSLVPLVVEYPIERNGVLREMGYYTSAHPALLSPEVVRAGQAYVHTMIDLAAKRLSTKGVPIPSNLIDMAEKLCIVEHADHTRFRNENRKALFEEIFALYALNELDTYKHSVSFAGAGGMVQMIPSTYQMIRRLYPGVGLNPDFVLGMRNHGNALEAMLLYVLETWKGLSASSDVIAALNSGIATQQELLAAGYNSNPARLPLYIRRGGAGWRTLIPRETQMYLQIHRSLVDNIPMKPRS